MRGTVFLLSLTLFIDTGNAQLLEKRNEQFFEASCDAVWQHALTAFADEGFDPENMDRQSGFVKFNYTRGIIERNVNDRLRLWTRLNGSLVAYWLRVDDATLLLRDEPVGCHATIKVNFSYYRKPFLESPRVVVAPTNGRLERRILKKIIEANPEALDLRMTKREQNSNASAVPKTGTLEIASDPSGADIEIDGQFVGMTPTSKSLKPGGYTVTVRKANYRPWTRKLEVQPGDSVTISAELESTFLTGSSDKEEPKPQSEPDEKPSEKPKIRIIRK